MKRIEKSSSRRPPKEKEQATKIKEKKKRRDRREKVVARRDDDETAVAKRAGARVLIGLVFLNSGKKRMESVIRDFNAAINIRRFAVLKTRPQELTRAIFGAASQAKGVQGEAEIDSRGPVEKKL